MLAIRMQRKVSSLFFIRYVLKVRLYSYVSKQKRFCQYLFLK